MSSAFDPKELTEEKSLYDIFKKAIKMEGNKFNGLILIFAALALAGHLLYLPENPQILISKIKWLTDIGVSVSTGILGFLVAGFTIFATITDKALFVHMARVKHPKYPFSYFKYSLFSFMYVFIVYISFLLVCIFTKILFDTQGVTTTLLTANRIDVSVVRVYGLSTLYVVMALWFIYLVLLLKTFVYNMYHVVTISVRWEIEQPRMD